MGRVTHPPRGLDRGVEGAWVSPECWGGMWGLKWEWEVRGGYWVCVGPKMGVGDTGGLPGPCGSQTGGQRQWGVMGSVCAPKSGL